MTYIQSCIHSEEFSLWTFILLQTWWYNVLRWSNVLRLTYLIVCKMYIFKWNSTKYSSLYPVNHSKQITGTSENEVIYRFKGIWSPTMFLCNMYSDKSLDCHYLFVLFECIANLWKKVLILTSYNIIICVTFTYLTDVLIFWCLVSAT